METVELEDISQIRIGGIKFSQELVQLTVESTSSTSSPIDQLLYLIAEKNINITFLCQSSVHTSQKHSTIFCIDSSEYNSVQQILNNSTLANQQLTVDSITSVGTVTLFPHRNSLEFIGRVLKLSNEGGFSIYSFCTSISAFAMNCDFRKLDEIAATLQMQFELPENHAPFRNQFQVKQIQL